MLLATGEDLPDISALCWIKVNTFVRPGLTFVIYGLAAARQKDGRSHGSDPPRTTESPQAIAPPRISTGQTC